MLETWAGIYCALWTPLDASGHLLRSALRANLEFLKLKGVDGVLALGSTGEFLQLEPVLRKEVIETVLEFSGPLRVMMNISDVRPAVVLDLAQFARKNNIPAVSLLPPYFYPMAQVDLVEFFVRAAEASGRRLFLYNFPERTGNRISLDTVAAVADRVPLAGIKQSGNEFGYHKDLAELGRQKGFVVLTGSDTRLPEAMALGVAGCVSGLANAVPDLVVDAFRVASSQTGTAAPVSANRLCELRPRIGEVNFPLDVSACMEARGLEVGACKTIVSKATKDRYARLVSELHALFAEWKLT
jgi:4-hydroxy-tetrahydrodipicolinate synthase